MNRRRWFLASLTFCVASAACSSDNLAPVVSSPSLSLPSPPPLCELDGSVSPSINNPFQVSKVVNGGITPCAPRLNLSPEHVFYHQAEGQTGPARPAYQGTVGLTSDRAMFNVRLIAEGTLICESNLGELRLYNGSTLVETVPITATESCNEFGLAGSAAATPGYIGPVTRIEIFGPSQWTKNDLPHQTS
jgi:hypothetical protein